MRSIMIKRIITIIKKKYKNKKKEKKERKKMILKNNANHILKVIIYLYDHSYAFCFDGVGIYVQDESPLN